MDASVLAAIARWPNVPAVYGWLELTARGAWRIKGAPIANRAIIEFIERNYGADERGRWYFQNGPQRVYVTLDLAPWVYRAQPDGSLRTHTGARPQTLRQAALLDDGRLVLLTELGPGNLDDRDALHVLPALCDPDGLALAEAALERALHDGSEMSVAAHPLQLQGSTVPLERLRVDQLGAAFGFVTVPQAD